MLPAGLGAGPAVDGSARIDPAGRRATLAEAGTGRRPVWFDGGRSGGGWRDTPIYWRDWLPADLRLDGPAVIEQMDATIVIEPGDRAAGDAGGNIFITVGGAAP